MALFEAQGLHKRFGDQVVLEEINLSFEEGQLSGIMGPNGAGKATLFEFITGSNSPSAGEVRCLGRNAHNIKYQERDRLAIHCHQSYQVRHFKKTRPSFVLEPAGSDYPTIHLFDEPQFNTRDRYIGFMVDFFRKLRAEGRLVFLCVHPSEPFHLDILREICKRYIFVRDGQLSHAPGYETPIAQPAARDYLGAPVA